MEKLSYLFYFKEIANVKSVQKENFNAYLNTICDFPYLYSNYYICKNNIDNFYIDSMEKESRYKCSKEYYEMMNCDNLRKVLITKFKEKQDKFIDDIYVKGKKYEG